MLRLTIPFLLSALFLVSFGCEKDNFEIVEENPETTDPTVIETDGSFISYRMPSGSIVNQGGIGVINDQGLVGLATAETAVAECLENGSISLRTNGAGLTLGFNSSPLRLIGAGANDLEGAEGTRAFWSVSCQGAEPVLELTALTDERAAGTALIEFFTLHPDSSSSINCEGTISLGLFEVEFDVALEPCS